MHLTKAQKLFHITIKIMKSNIGNEKNAFMFIFLNESKYYFFLSLRERHTTKLFVVFSTYVSLIFIFRINSGVQFWDRRDIL